MHEIVTWGAAVAGLVGFGLAMGLNPALYGATADMLARRVRVRARLLWMVSGLALGATILLLIFHGMNPSSIVAASRGTLDAVLVNRAVDLAAGFLFALSAGWVLWWKVRAPTVLRTSKKASKSTSRPFSYFFLGLGACIGFATLPIMYLTGRLIAGLTAEPALRVIAYGVFLAALASPFFVLAWLWTRFPAFTARITGFYGRALLWDYRGALAAALGAASLVFLGLALFAVRGS